MLRGSTEGDVLIGSVRSCHPRVLVSTSRGRGSLDLEVSRGTVAIIVSISHDWERISEAQMQPWVVELEQVGLAAAQSRNRRERARVTRKTRAGSDAKCSATQGLALGPPHIISDGLGCMQVAPCLLLAACAPTERAPAKTGEREPGFGYCACTSCP